jgi:hypothetical protein
MRNLIGHRGGQLHGGTEAARLIHTEERSDDVIVFLAKVEDISAWDAS